MQQKITIPNKRGEKLVGLLHEAGSPELVVLCHGFESSKESNVIVSLALRLESEGISVFRFDFSGIGESEGPFNYGNYWSEAEDLRAVVEYFTLKNRLIVTVVGHSRGGNVALLYASKYHDIGSVVNISGRYDLKTGIVKCLGKGFFVTLMMDGYIDVKTKTGEVSYRVTEESMVERFNTAMHKSCLSIDEKCRVLTVHGKADRIVPVEDASEFGKVIPNHRLRTIEGADHEYTSHLDELASVVSLFVKECKPHAGDVPK